MNATETENTTTIGCYLLTWGEVNVGEHPDEISFDPEPEAYTPWTYYPKRLTVPAGWRVSKSEGGSIELYTEAGKHVAIVQVAGHRKSVQVAWADGHRWLAMGDSDAAPVCPTCGK